MTEPKYKLGDRIWTDWLCGEGLKRTQGVIIGIMPSGHEWGEDLYNYLIQVDPFLADSINIYIEEHWENE